MTDSRDRAAEAEPVAETTERKLAEFMRAHSPVLVLTGAGVSTQSGIPDYRDRDGHWKRAEPMRAQLFLRDPMARRRYWARSFVGWPKVAAAEPNVAHRAIAAWEGTGHIRQIVTQNVDGLHQRAGARRVIDLHGRLDCVDCLSCGSRLTRATMQELLAEANPDCARPESARLAPDGDALVHPHQDDHFIVPPCPACGGVLKPAVVFFGENVPRARVERADQRLEQSRGLLVIGSSLSVFSGYRFCLHAAKANVPIAILNQGRTRADQLANLKLDCECGAALESALTGR